MNGWRPRKAHCCGPESVRRRCVSCRKPDSFRSLFKQNHKTQSKWCWPKWLHCINWKWRATCKSQYSSYDEPVRVRTGPARPDGDRTVNSPARARRWLAKYRFTADQMSEPSPVQTKLSPVTLARACICKDQTLRENKFLKLCYQTSSHWNLILFCPMRQLLLLLHGLPSTVRFCKSRVSEKNAICYNQTEIQLIDVNHIFTWLFTFSCCYMTYEHAKRNLMHHETIRVENRRRFFNLRGYTMTSKHWVFFVTLCNE